VIDVRSLGAAEPFITADGSTIRELCGIPTGGTTLQSLAEATLAPGQATERHYHAVSEEVYFILEGEGELELDGDVGEVRRGDAIPIPPGTWHTLRNTGTVSLRLLCSCAPPYRHEDTFFEE
jgi:mannose-6-phosphate isomerase-like protein (cupin superfamily)